MFSWSLTKLLVVHDVEIRENANRCQTKKILPGRVHLRKGKNKRWSWFLGYVLESVLGYENGFRGDVAGPWLDEWKCGHLRSAV